MKQITAVFLVMILVLGLLAGCSDAPVLESPETLPAPAENGADTVEYTEELPLETITVSNIDEFLAALGSHREIIMEPGNYDLTLASDYGTSSENGSYIWEQVSDGYQLTLVDVRALTIRGGGMDNTTLETQPRYANVLRLRNCTDVLLQDFTAGHTKEQGECSGGVVLIEGSSLVTLHRLGLFGCGVNGVRADICSQIDISECHIYDCSSSGIVLSECRDVEILSTRLERIGTGDYGGYTVVEAMRSSDVTLEHCQVTDCNAMYLITAGGTTGLELRGSEFTGNRVKEYAFELHTSDMLMDGCSFMDNSIRVWCSPYMERSAGLLTDAEGAPLTEEDLAEMYPASEAPQELAERKVVEAATVDEFLAAIASDTEIVLTGELYDLSTATGYGEAATDRYHWVEEFDGPALVINSVDNLVIQSNDGDVSAHTISATPRYADVITFLGCSNVTVSGFTAGHTKEPGVCAGGVITIRDSDHITVENCGLFGCGILGVEAEYSGNITVSGCDIYECSQGGIKMRSVTGAVIENCTFRDLGGDELTFISCQEVTVDGKPWNG